MVHARVYIRVPYSGNYHISFKGLQSHALSLTSLSQLQFRLWEVHDYCVLWARGVGYKALWLGNAMG